MLEHGTWTKPHFEEINLTSEAEGSYLDEEDNNPLFVGPLAASNAEPAQPGWAPDPLGASSASGVRL
jgi:hypothetical protein